MDTSLFKPIPGYFNNVDYLGALVLLQLVLASLWHYEIVYFPLLVIFFLWAGMDLPFASVGMTARWLVLVVAAFAGFVMWMRERRHTYDAFHLVALFCVAAALVSALVSADAPTSLLKVLSLFLLFLYGATGARLAIFGRETKFVKGLLIGCELVVYASAISLFGSWAAHMGKPELTWGRNGCGHGPDLVVGRDCRENQGPAISMSNCVTDGGHTPIRCAVTSLNARSCSRRRCPLHVAAATEAPFARGLRWCLCAGVWGSPESHTFRQLRQFGHI